ncbi:unnamed protein product, partial [Iphiclides podalirius]
MATRPAVGRHEENLLREQVRPRRDCIDFLNALRLDRTPTCAPLWCAERSHNGPLFGPRRTALTGAAGWAGLRTRWAHAAAATSIAGETERALGGRTMPRGGRGRHQAALYGFPAFVAGRQLIAMASLLWRWWPRVPSKSWPWV